MNYNFNMKNSRVGQSWLKRVGQAENSAGWDQEQETMISMLLNAIHYYLDCALVIHSARQFRLLVFHLDRVLLDKQYTTLKGAKIAFHKIYRHQACVDGVKARWDEYVPEGSWIEKKMAILERKKEKPVDEIRCRRFDNGNLSAISKPF